MVGSKIKRMTQLSAASNISLSKRKQFGKAWPWALGVVVVAAAAALWMWKGRAADDNAAGGAASSAASGASGPGGPGGNRRFGGGFGGGGPQPVSVDAVRRQDMRVMVNAIGTMTASNTAVVRAQVNGVLQALNFKEGQQVAAGQVLAQIDPRAFQATLSQAEGTLARDKAQLENARIDLTRYRDLFAKDAVPKQQLDTQDALVRQLEGTVRADQGNVDSARLQLSYTSVKAPISGRVGLKQVDLGNVVQPSDANGVVSITQTHPIALVFAVPASQLPRIAAKLKAGVALPVEAWDRDGKTRLAVGRVASVDNAIDLSTDTIKLKALFDNQDDALYPNQSVSVRLQVDTVADTLAVPQSAVLTGTQGAYVYVVNADSSVSTRVVKSGTVDGQWIAISGPLQEGERVVTDGVDRLRDGAKVEVIAADPKQRAGASAPAGGGRRGAHGPGGAASGAGWAGRPASAASR